MVFLSLDKARVVAATVLQGIRPTCKESVAEFACVNGVSSTERPLSATRRAIFF